jgi:hypothetical protein
MATKTHGASFADIDTIVMILLSEAVVPNLAILDTKSDEENFLKEYVAKVNLHKNYEEYNAETPGLQLLKKCVENRNFPTFKILFDDLQRRTTISSLDFETLMDCNPYPRLYFEFCVDSLLQTAYDTDTSLNIVHFLLNVDSNKNPTRILDLLIKYQLYDILNIQISKMDYTDNAFWGYNGGNILSYCCRKGYVDIVRFLLQQGEIDPNADASSAMMQAIRYDHADIAKLLLEDPRFNITFNDNYLITHVCDWGRTEILKLFLQRPEVDIHAHNNRAFIRAVRNDAADIIDLLTSDLRYDQNMKAPLLTPHKVAMTLLKDEEELFADFYSPYLL